MYVIYGMILWSKSTPNNFVDFVVLAHCVSEVGGSLHYFLYIHFSLISSITIKFSFVLAVTITLVSSAYSITFFIPVQWSSKSLIRSDSKGPNVDSYIGWYWRKKSREIKKYQKWRKDHVQLCWHRLGPGRTVCENQTWSSQTCKEVVKSANDKCCGTSQKSNTRERKIE